MENYSNPPSPVTLNLQSNQLITPEESSFQSDGTALIFCPFDIVLERVVPLNRPRQQLPTSLSSKNSEKGNKPRRIVEQDGNLIF
jgi:hypothetical protein